MAILNFRIFFAASFFVFGTRELDWGSSGSVGTAQLMFDKMSVRI